ncbi:hypothetical protein [Microcystis sp. M112S1]|uniref:hypothetical protein n=1 Tax=Microcystis sp. M112S1 TaxID=2771103 RepID=UPI0025895080|nr:hypothetical protein [Microcystis sp. M112S1]
MSSRSEFVQFHPVLFSPGIQPGDRRSGSPTPIEVGSVRDGQYSRSSKILGLKPRRRTTALPLNTSAFTKYMLKCSPWKKPTRLDFTPHQNNSRYCGALWAV